jgi:hypothetical protein
MFDEQILAKPDGNQRSSQSTCGVIAKQSPIQEPQREYE